MAEVPVSNPERILRKLDSYLERETRIVLFGRAALALGFGKPGSQFGTTMDVDAILPSVEMGRIEADVQFWRAIELTNKSLLPEGLYVSHLFTDKQVALTPDWLEKIVEIESSEFRFLRMFRPSAVDLILTKMMRNDPQDIGDIRFILSQGKVETADLERAFASARPLEIAELQEIFVKMKPLVRELAASSKSIGDTSQNRARDLDPYWWSRLTQPPELGRSKEKDRGLEL
jgi:hypothetical protein